MSKTVTLESDPKDWIELAWTEFDSPAANDAIVPRTQAERALRMMADYIRALPLPPSPVKDECDHPEVSREFVSGIRCGECGKTSLKETPPVKESRDAALIDELRGWKAGEKASDDTVRMIWIMNKAADALEGKLT